MQVVFLGQQFIPPRRFGLFDLTQAPAMALLFQRNGSGREGIELWAARTGRRHEPPGQNDV
jgi:hypothetical protein